MYVIREVFQCKPGKAKDLIAKFKKSFEAMPGGNPRILVDAVAGYWTVVLESEAASLADFEKSMTEYGSKPEIRAAMEGYMEFVKGGHREIFKIA